MLKSIQLTLSKIKYSGESIGDDIRVEIEALGKSLRVDKRVAAGTTAEVNQVVGSFETDRKSFEFNTQVTVIEKDLLFNDVGSASGEIKVDATITEPQQFPFEIKIDETRSILGKPWGGKTAAFEITLTASVSDLMKYIPNDEIGHGWITVVLENDKVEIPLPAYLKVKPERIQDGREYFSIMEGPYRGKSASVILNENGSSQLISGIEHVGPARMSYSISKKIFVLKGKKYKTVDYRDFPWQKGLYDVEIPDYPHPGGENYEEDAPRAKTWFRIGHDGERYLHAGGRSLGCMTVIEITRWFEIYDALIKARKGDFTSVGILEVVD